MKKVVPSNLSSNEGTPQQSNSFMQDSGAWLAAFCDAAMDGIVILDDQQHIVYLNPAAERIFLCLAAEVIGKSLDVFIPELLRETHRKHMRLFAETNTTRHKPGITRFAAVRANGEQFPLEITVSQFQNGGKKFFSAILRDDSEREYGEKALRESEMRYRTLADAAHDMIWIVNAGGRIEYVNMYAAQQFGKTPQQLIGTLYHDLFPLAIARRHWKIIGRVLSTGEPTYVEWLNQFLGNLTWLGTSLAPLRDDKGDVYAVLGVGRDITARKETEQALLRHDAILEVVSLAAESFLRTANLQDHIDEMLAHFGRAAQVSRVYVYQNYVDEAGAIWSSQRFEWASTGIKSQLQNPDLQNVALSTIGNGRWLSALSQGQALHGYVDTMDESGRVLIVSQGILSVVVVPIFSGNSLWGFMGVDESKSRREWSPMEIQALRTAADILGAAIQREEAEGNLRAAVEELNHRVNQLEALYESGLAMGQALDPKTIGEKVIDVLAERLNWDHAAVRLREEDGDGVELVAFGGSRVHFPGQMQNETRARKVIAHITQGLVGWVLRTGNTLRVNNLEEDERYVRTFPGMSSGLYVPMKVDGATIGCISVESPDPDAFSEADERLVSTLSAQAAVAIEKARLFKQTQRRLEQVSVLHQIDVVISSSADFHSTLKFVLEHILAQLSVDAAQVLLLDASTMSLVYADSAGFPAQRKPEIPVAVQKSRAGKAVLERRPLFVPNLAEYEKGGPEFGSLPGRKFRAYACVPLVAKGEIKGVLEVFNCEPLTLSDEWMEFFQVLASQTAIAIDNSLMFEDLQRSNLELSLAYDATIEGWSRALDLRDKETEGHTQRVTMLSVRLATRLGLSETEIVHLRRGGLLHDIGKMGVTDTILNKPGPLTDEEFEIMRQHPGYAYDMLMPISYLRPALDIPYSHHEKWDGTGYPLGLKGEQIPLVARIFAVSDVFDALTSNRPYRTAWSVKKTLDYIHGQSGRHFDPKIVEAFLAMIIEEGP